MKDKKQIFITVLDRDETLSVGDILCLKKEIDSAYDDEAIIAYRVEAETLEEIDAETLKDITMLPEDDLYVANSVRTVARGTYSAGRIYDKFDEKAFAKVIFVLKGCAICEFYLEQNQ